MQIVGVEAIGRLADCAFDLGRPELGLDRTDDAARDLVLQFEDIVEGAVKAVGPDMRAARCVDELAGDAHAAAGFTYRTFEDVAHAQFARHLLNIDGPALVTEA